MVCQDIFYTFTCTWSTGFFIYCEKSFLSTLHETLENVSKYIDFIALKFKINIVSIQRDISKYLY